MRFSVVFLILAALPAHSDSCWTYDGSVVRLMADGPERTFVYVAPHAGLRAIGVEAGTVVFTGTTNDGWYAGNIRVPSTACPAQVPEFAVEGPASEDKTQITMRGQRQVYEGCETTEETVEDVHVFHYAYFCE